MGLSNECRACLIRRQQEDIESRAEEDKKEAYLEEVKKLIEDSQPEDTAPVVTERISKLHQEYFHTTYSFESLKVDYNEMMLGKEDEIRKQIFETNDPLLAAVKYARVGNYIDFGALGSVDNDKLRELLDRAVTEEIDAVEFKKFKQQIIKATQLVYLTDNCGEIVLDKLLIEAIQKINPICEITLIVRGIPVLNDATMEDAEEVGLTQMVTVIGNGTGIAGTSLKHISQESKEAIQKSDVIISKGQGNFETLNHCGYNVYYLFLCKCKWFVKRFGLCQFQGVFVNDCNLQ